MAAPRKLLDKLVKKDEKNKKKAKKAEDVPLGKGMAGDAKKKLQGRKKQLDDMIRQNGG